MKVQQLLDLLDSAATLLEADGSSQRAENLRAFAKAIDPLRTHGLDVLLDVLARTTLEKDQS
jgi:hypothetical protein